LIKNLPITEQVSTKRTALNISPAKEQSPNHYHFINFPRRQAVLCILAESFDEPNYKKLVTALCNEHQIPLIRVDSHKKLGEWSGLCKIDKEGKPRKVCGCSVVVIKDFGEETPALDVVKDHLRQNS